MPRRPDPHQLASPRIYLVRMLVFLVIAGFISAILFPQVYSAFLANPVLNSLIFGVLLIGIVLAIRQVFRLFPEVAGSTTSASPTLASRSHAPRCCSRRWPASCATAWAARRSRRRRCARSSIPSATASTKPSDILRYLTGLLVFLGLLGTF